MLKLKLIEMTINRKEGFGVTAFVCRCRYDSRIVVVILILCTYYGTHFLVLWFYH